MRKNAVLSKTQSIRRVAGGAAILAVSYLLQCSLGGQLPLGLAKPNLLLVAAASLGFLWGPTSGMLAGFFLGLFVDIQFGSALGLYAFLYMAIGFANGSARRIIFGDDRRWCVLLIGLSDLIYGTAVYVLMFLLRGKFDFFYYFGHVILPESLSTVILAVALCPVIFYVTGRSRPRGRSL